MRFHRLLSLLPVVATLGAVQLRAGDLDTTGFIKLWATHPELTGAGQTVAQPEAAIGSAYQVNPAAVGQPAGLFHYYDSTHPYGGAGASFTLSLESGHADTVGSHLFGAATGGAPSVHAVENFDANYFYNNVVANVVTVGSTSTWEPVAIASPIVNQSFVFSQTDPATVAQVNRFYDAYANAFGTLFISGLNNGAGTFTNAPASMYNGIAVGQSDGTHSGRALLVAPGGATSFATPYVTAAAVVLRQAAELGDFTAISGTDPTDARVLKVGLLNGATKTAGWSHTTTDPLDVTAGSGVLNVDASFLELSGGQHALSSSASITRGTIPTNSTFTAPISSLNGWDLRSLTTTNNHDVVGHYFFDLTTSGALTFVATLTWDSIANLSLGTDTINNFDLVLVDSISHATIWTSVSTTQNVEQVYVTNLAGSRYDLQVILRGAASSRVSDTYAVAWSWQPGPVPESRFVWTIAIAGFLFIAGKRRRCPVPATRA